MRVRRIEGNELAESCSCVFPQSDLQDGDRRRPMQGIPQLGPVSWNTGLFRKSAWMTKKQRRRIDPKKQQQSGVTAAEGILGKSREY